MIAILLLIWIGTQINAPSWYFAVCIVTLCLKIGVWIVNAYKEGQSNPFG